MKRFKSMKDCRKTLGHLVKTAPTGQCENSFDCKTSEAGAHSISKPPVCPWELHTAPKKQFLDIISWCFHCLIHTELPLHIKCTHTALILHPLLLSFAHNNVNSKV